MCTQKKAFFSIGQAEETWKERGPATKHAVGDPEIKNIYTNLKSIADFHGFQFHCSIRCMDWWIDSEQGCTVNFYVNMSANHGGQF